MIAQGSFRTSAHSSQQTHSPHLSPSSPQLWISAVNKAVDKSLDGARFAPNVRLSPHVDHLWTGNASPATTAPLICGHIHPSCAQPSMTHSPSTRTHNRGDTSPTHSPQSKMASLRGLNALVHTFPRTYDDDYLLISMDPETNNGISGVDDSRTLGFLDHTTTDHHDPLSDSRLYQGGPE